MPLAYGLIQPIDIALPNLPPGLDGLRIAHISDLHTKRRTDRLGRLLEQLTAARIDLVALTGDYMDFPPDDEPAMDYLRDLCARVKPVLGFVGVFGNHDYPLLRELSSELPVRWLIDDVVQIPVPKARGHRPGTIELMGLDCRRDTRGDAVRLALRLDESRREFAGAAGEEERPLRLMLAHLPSVLPTASDLGADLVLAGHTHGGQMRLPNGRVLMSGIDGFPCALASGLLRHRDTFCLISRGMGETMWPIRAFCPAHVPLITLRRRSAAGRFTDDIDVVWRW